jgi:hypothetical protein
MKIKIRNTMWERRSAYFFEIKEFNEYEGDEVKVKWCKPQEIAISTANPEFPFRILQRANIVEIDGLPYSYDVTPKVESVRLVQGSNGKVYEVTSNSCTCQGFTFRGTCKHVGSKS